MAISTYSELQTAIQNWLDNTNTIPVERAQEFIRLAEADFQRRLRVRENLVVTTGTLTATTATLALPADFGGIQSLTVTSNGYPDALGQLSPDAAADAYAGYGNGVPEHYVIEGANLRFYPTPDSAYAYGLWYWQRVAALSDSAPTNWVLTRHPDLYLFGALSQAEGYLVNDQRAVLWRAAYEQAIEQIAASSALESMGRGMQVTEGATP